MRRLFMLVPILAAAELAAAADVNERFAPKGAGTITCEVFVEEHERESDAYILFRGWIDGYITAVNQLTPETFDIAAWESTAFLASVIDNHCRKNPEDSVMAVTMAIVEGLHDDRITRSSPLVTAEAGDQSMRIYEATLVEVQSALIELGLLSEAPTGRFTAATSAALTRYQTAQNLTPTGLPDENTLWALLRPLPVN